LQVEWTELGVLRDISKWPDGPFIMSRRLKIPIVPVNITETGTFRPPLKRAIPKAPRSFIKRTVQVIRVIKKTKRLFKKIAMMFCGIVIVLNAFIQFVKWLVFILMNYQWYCFFVETYFDILDPIYPDNLSTQELKQKVFDSMEKQICERLLWIENKKMDEQKTKDVIFKLILFTVVFLTFIYLLSK